jgi:hypothetical protein
MSSLEATAFADVTEPEWYRDVVWQVAAGLMTGDEAVAVLIGEHHHTHSEVFGEGGSAPATPV